MKRTFLIIGVMAVAAFAGILVANKTLNKPTLADIETTATLLTPAKPLLAFKLTDIKNRPFDLDALKGKWTWVFFGYTFCPDVCPTALATLRSTYQKLEEERPQVVFVSVDPERDTLDKLQQYVKYFHEDFNAATGNDEALQILTNQLGVLYTKLPKTQAQEHYLVDHSGAIMLINPKGEWQAVHSSPQQPETLAQDFLKIVAAYDESSG